MSPSNVPSVLDCAISLGSGCLVVASSHTVTAWDREYSVLRVGSPSVVPPSLYSAARSVRPNPNSNPLDVIVTVIVTVDSTIFVIVVAAIVVNSGK